VLKILKHRAGSSGSALFSLNNRKDFVGLQLQWYDICCNHRQKLIFKPTANGCLIMSFRIFFPLRLFIMLLSFSAAIPGSAQISGSATDSVYGSDPLLYNGKLYTFFPPFNTGGNQYLKDKQFEKGSLTIRGEVFNDVPLIYDIYNQQLIMKYKSKVGGENLIIISDAWLESFKILGMKFEVFTFQDTLKKYSQVFGEGPLKILYNWSKVLNLDSFHGARNFVFSSPKKEMSLEGENRLLQFSNNKTFCSFFDPAKKNVVKAYLRKNNIRIKKASDATMTSLIYFCNSLYSK
jgi:hypothetical protein